LADKATQLILDALGRAAADPPGRPLYSSKTAPGLFPRTASARLAARRCQDEGLIRTVATDPGKPPREVCAITDKGVAFLLDQVNPRQVLEDCVRALEAREAQLADLVRAARHLHETLDGLKGVVRQVLPHLTPPAPASPPASPNGNGKPHAEPADWAGGALAELGRWREAGASEDCPLPDLYRHLAAAHAGLSIGRFHDGLRRLHDEGHVYLHPWTGPLYELPEPAFALLVGHEIAYYASART
jgi:hypothetical protein